MKAKVMRTQERHNVAQGVGGRGDESDRWTERHEREREREKRDGKREGETKKKGERKRDRGKQRERHKVTGEETPKRQSDGPKGNATFQGPRGAFGDLRRGQG